jgi:asparagine synthase (glutamine-hydrolysing)
VVSWSPDSASVPAASITGSPLPFDERDLVQALADEMDVPAVFGPGIAGEAPWLAALDGLTQPRRTVARESHVLPIVAGLGVRHVLSGWGGDEFASFNGRATNRQLVRTLRLGPLREAYRDLRARRRSPLRAVADLAREGLPAGLSRRRGAALPDHVVQRERDLARAAADFPALVARYRVFEAAQSGARGPRDYQLALLASGHLTRRVEAWHEAGRRFGVQYHHPLLDPRIVEWALSMPPEVFRTGGHSRRVFRLAVRGLVPEAVRLSTKDDPVLLRFLQQAGPAGG